MSLLNKIENIRMVGDNMHNEIIDIIFNNIDKRSKNYKRILESLEYTVKDSTQRWIFHKIGKTEAKKINAIMKSKTEKTFQKKLRRFIEIQYDKAYGSIFEKEKIKGFSKWLETPIQTISKREAFDNMFNNYLANS